MGCLFTEWKNQWASTRYTESPNVDKFDMLRFNISPGGHKGYGLAMMVDVFCGILSGSSFGPTMRKWQGDDERVADLVGYTQLQDLNPDLYDAVAALY